MAFSAHKDPAKLEEHFAEASTVEAQAQQLAELIKNSKHFVVFTGAGISTSAGIPDFRGPQGVWTLRDQGKEVQYGVDIVEAVPTFTHMTLVELHSAGYLKFLISQNCDGLHRRSGFTAKALAELHGNSNLEYCPKCKTEYLRDFDVCRESNEAHEHETGRNCTLCGTPLLDTIINFTEDLPKKPLKDGFHHARKSDLFLVLGSSLTVTPACEMPAVAVSKKSKLVICNLQTTSQDETTTIRIFQKTDLLMHLVCQHLSIKVPQWKLNRYFVVHSQQQQGSRTRPRFLISLKTIDKDETPTTLLKSIKLTVDAANNQQSVISNVQSNENYVSTSSEFTFTGVQSLPITGTIAMSFMGHYGEPPLELHLQFLDSQIIKLQFEFDPFGPREWKQLQ